MEGAGLRPALRFKMIHKEEAVTVSRLDDQQRITLRQSLIFSILITAGILTALCGRFSIGNVSALYPLASAPQPYFIWQHTGLLYLLLPLVVAGSFILLMAPGAISILLLRQARNLSEWLILGFGVSLLLMIGLGVGTKFITGASTPFIFITIWTIVVFCLLVILIVRARSGADQRWPMEGRSDRRRLIWIALMIYAVVVAFLPKIFWEDFNLDGIEAFEFGRSLSSHFLPHWEIFDNVFGTYANFFLFAYPNHWFLSLFGPFEATARLPYVLYLLLTFAALVLFIEAGKSSKLGWREEGTVWLALIAFTIVQAFSTNYEPFFADLAETAAPDLLQIVCFLSACYALFSRRLRWFRLFAWMVFAAGPGGLLLLVSLGAAVILSRMPEKRELLKEVGVILFLCGVVTLLYETLYINMFLGGVNDQFSMKNLLRRLYPPTVTEFVRWNALLFPSGILPALSLVTVRKRDQPEWVISIVTILYFGAIYIQAWTSLHQFTAVMILPLVVFWRLFLDSSVTRRRWIYPTVLFTTLLSFIFSLPPHFQINQATREFGIVTVYEVGNYDHDYETTLRGGTSLYALFPQDYRINYPNQIWGTDHRVLIYYATRPKPKGTVLNYFVQPASESPPPEASVVQSTDGVVVYVRDFSLWEKHRERQYPQVPGSPLYEPILSRTYQFFREHVAKKSFHPLKPVNN